MRTIERPQKTLRELWAKRIAAHGPHIYAYCHVQTKQVLYSLDRTLQPFALKQLPDIGANHSPPVLRKDVWKPLFSVHLPNTEIGRNQTLDAYDKLQKYRDLHETNWEPPLELSMKMNKKKREELKERLETRGGSKTEKVHQLIKREKKKLRKRIIMNQKANSIADLAAVLLEQGDEGAARQARADEEDRQKRLSDVQEMQDLVNRQGEMIPALHEELEGLKTDIAQERLEGSKAQARLRIKIIEKQIERIRFADAAVAWLELPASRRQQETQYWNEIALSDIAREQEAQSRDEAALRDAKRGNIQNENEEDHSESNITLGHSEVAEDVEVPTGTQAIGVLLGRSRPAWAEELPDCNGPQMAVYAKMVGVMPDLPEVAERTQEESTGKGKGKKFSKSAIALLPSFPPTFDTLKLPLEKSARNKRLKKAADRKLLKLRHFSAEGVVVRWADPLDAEFAQEWPAEIRHQRMGLVRHTQPPITDEPIKDVSVFKALQWKRRIGLWEESMEPETLRKVREIRSKMNLVKEWKSDPHAAPTLIDAGKLSKFTYGRLEASKLTPAQLIAQHNANVAEAREHHTDEDGSDELVAEDMSQDQAEIIDRTSEERIKFLKQLRKKVLRETLKERPQPESRALPVRGLTRSKPAKQNATP